MFKKEDSHTVSAASGETVIAQGVKVEGNFTSKGDIFIDGELSGSIATAESLHIGQTAKIQADVKAKTAIIAGEVDGNIEIEGRLELLETSRVTGDVSSQTLSVAAGAKVNGRVSMTEGVKATVREGNKKKEMVEEPVLG